jgi:hypothetical protein
MEMTSFGLEDPETLETAAALAPVLFGTLALAHSLRAKLPIESMDLLLRALFDDDLAGRAGYRATREEVEDMCFAFPITEPQELVRRLYLVAGIAHEKVCRSMPEKGEPPPWHG